VRIYHEDGDIKVQFPGFTYVCSDKTNCGAFVCDYLSWNTIQEEKKMKFNFDFGPVNPNLVRMSMYGLAVKNRTGTWVSYDANSGEIMDVDILNFDGAKFLYRAPVPMKDIAVGDIVIHQGAPMFVTGTSVDGKALIAVDPIAGERKEVMLAKSPFGFNFATKVVNFLGGAFNAEASADSPFGNMWMLMMLNDSEGANVNDMLPLMMMANGGLDMSNPLMAYALMNRGNGSNEDLLPMMMMMGAGLFGGANTTKACQCHCNESMS
jgi:hypothetical protein